MSEWPPLPPRNPPRVQHLFAFLRASDRAPMTCEIRFHGDDAYGFAWEVVFYDRGELSHSRGAFAERWQAVQWAEEERKALEGGA